jgi:hypothetical protein
MREPGTKHWTASHAIWAAAIALLVNVLQITLRVVSAAQEMPLYKALESIDWGSWGVTLAGLLAAVGVAWARVKNGNDPTSASPKLTV